MAGRGDGDGGCEDAISDSVFSLFFSKDEDDVLMMVMLMKMLLLLMMMC
ncbi:hypothetical protein LOK49_LG12G02870 [Camellia lanceoleosa]|uniref:Uncharacterized protein n=1 Tax=Camellia lanceoleosa TaxID=1840588 RepID=A0ACC0FV40_9ERIC|nr:hypothetical protein LOK49_LG12G02870 [Camellia lanceoleosa]